MGHFNHTSGAAMAARRLRTGSFAVVASLLLLTTLLVSPAQADHVECGDVITEDTTLTHDVGPCSDDGGRPGLIVRGDDVTLDLGGHRLFATPDSNGPWDAPGIRIGRSTGATVQNGTVEGFDAGVEIAGGSGNTVQGVTAVNNVNDLEEPFEFVSGLGVEDQPDVQSGDVTAPAWLGQMLCVYGDGITTFDSDDNTIRDNRVVDNGPYGGITLVGDSDGNHVADNYVEGNNIPNLRADGGSGLCGAMNPGVAGMQRGRALQAIGVRMEGPGANDNMVATNRVDNSGLAGIAVHSYVCIPTDPGHPPQLDNSGNTIAGNTVSRTGMETVDIDSFADGISSLAQGPIGRVTCTSPDTTIVDNVSINNERHGVSLHRTSSDNTVEGNKANGNAGSGIYVAENTVDDEPLNNTLTANKAHHNDEADGFDGNADCDANDWMANRFKSVNQACVASGGTGWTDGPGRSGNAG